jgi:hypothetical protein
MVSNPYRKDIYAKVLASDCYLEHCGHGCESDRPAALRSGRDDLHHTPVTDASDYDPAGSLRAFLRPSSKAGVEVRSEAVKQLRGRPGSTLGRPFFF